MEGLRFAQSLRDQIKVSLRRGDPLGRFLLERMEDIQNSVEANRVDGAKGATFEVVTNLQNTTAEALKGLGVCRTVTKLRLKKGLTDLLPNFRRKRPQVLPTGADKDCWFDRA